LVVGKTNKPYRFATTQEVDKLFAEVARLRHEVEALKYRQGVVAALPSGTYGVALASRPACNIARDLPPTPKTRKKGG